MSSHKALPIRQNTTHATAPPMTPLREPQCTTPITSSPTHERPLHVRRESTLYHQSYDKVLGRFTSNYAFLGESFFGTQSFVAAADSPETLCRAHEQRLVKIAKLLGALFAARSLSDGSVKPLSKVTAFAVGPHHILTVTDIFASTSLGDQPDTFYFSQALTPIWDRPETFQNWFTATLVESTKDYALFDLKDKVFEEWLKPTDSVPETDIDEFEKLVKQRAYRLQRCVAAICHHYRPSFERYEMEWYSIPALERSSLRPTVDEWSMLVGDTKCLSPGRIVHSQETEEGNFILNTCTYFEGACGAPIVPLYTTDLVFLGIVLEQNLTNPPHNLPCPHEPPQPHANHRQHLRLRLPLHRPSTLITLLRAAEYKAKHTTTHTAIPITVPKSSTLLTAMRSMLDNDVRGAWVFYTVIGKITYTDILKYCVPPSNAEPSWRGFQRSRRGVRVLRRGLCMLRMGFGRLLVGFLGAAQMGWIKCWGCEEGGRGGTGG
ncbi:hypothetical protein HK097_006187 [Rhizophlyctis rosea]|uniref:Uncharacterized protein n=1 Tax=Rhizophlyctis rosea TaxID=64517 RepID=A0AAD5SJT1_9FUNG|nr:hypothetical protein HK097_006187 [Rhizophlyctis rosea]